MFQILPKKYLDPPVFVDPGIENNSIGSVQVSKGRILAVPVVQPTGLVYFLPIFLLRLNIDIISFFGIERFAFKFGQFHS